MRKPGRFWLSLSLLAAALTSLYMYRVQLPWEYAVNVGSGKVLEQLGDLYPSWVATRELFLFGRNPYGPEVSHQIQNAYYGHSIVQSYDNHGQNIIDEQRFAYPVYVAFLLSPTLHLGFAGAQLWSRIFLAFLTAWSVVLWLDVLNWRLSPPSVAAILLFTLSSPPVVQGLRLCQLGLLTGFLLASAAWCTKRHGLVAAGALLAVSTIKPQMMLLPLAWFFLWSVADLRHRWRLPATFLGVWGALVLAGEFVLPGWLGYFLAGLNAYRKYVPITSITEILLGAPLGNIVSVMVVAGLFGFACSNRKSAADSPEFVRVLSTVCIAELLVMSLLPPFNQVLLMLPMLMLLRDWTAIRRFARLTLGAVLAWPWATAAVLLLLLPAQPNPLTRFPLLPSALTLVTPLLLPLLLVDKAKPAATDIAPTHAISVR